MKTALILLAVGYGLMCISTFAGLMRKRSDKLAVAFVVAALWPVTLPWGVSLIKKAEDRAHEDLFSSYRTAGFDTLKIKNGRWIAGFSVADMDRGGQLVLVVPGFEVAPEDLQEVIAQPCATPREAIIDSIERQSYWQRATKARRKTEASIH